MARTLDGIDDALAAWIGRQPMFFVGSAPLAAEGHVNVSPKGPIGTLRVLGPRRVAYLDYAGSGAETIAHVRENGRIVVMVCAFDGPPRIVRLHGAARVVVAGTPAFGALVAQARFAEVTIAEARRAVIDVAVTRVAQSCGYGVPLMTHTGEREHYDRHKRGRLRVMGRDGLLRHQTTQNARSLDGLPALAPDGVGSHPAAATVGSGGGGPGHDRTQAHDAGGPVTGTAIDERELIRDLESLGSVLADDSFGEELYRALANTRWSKADGPDGHLSLSWNRAEGVVNQLREREGQEPLTLSQTGGEGEVSDRVAHELGRLGWSAGSRDTGRDDPAHQSAGRRPPPDTPAGASWEQQAHADADRTQGAE